MSQGTLIGRATDDECDKNIRSAVAQATSDSALNDVVRGVKVWQLSQETRALAASCKWNFIRCDLNGARSKPDSMRWNQI